MTALTRGDLKDRVLRFLNKTSTYPGFYDDEKINDAIREAFDFVAVEMFIGGEGWMNEFVYKTTAAGDSTVDISTDRIAMIHEVRYLQGEAYVPLTYTDGSDQTEYSSASGATQYPKTYRLMKNDVYFNPPLAEGGTNYLQIECFKYPTEFADDVTDADSQFDSAMYHYIKYKTCSVLAASMEKKYLPWSKEENEWYAKMMAVVNRRNRKFRRIREFGG